MSLLRGIGIFVSALVAGAAFYIFFLRVPQDLPSHTLDDLRNYFTMVNAFVTFFVGFFGLLLGAFYYFDREERSSRAETNVKTRARVRIMLEDLQAYDELVTDLVTRNWRSGQELERIRLRIGSRADSLNNVLDACADSLGLDSSELGTLVRVHGFVEKNDLLMHRNHTVVRRSNLLGPYLEYSELIKAAKRVCTLHSV